MKTIYLLRHGKSDWNDPSLSDYERPLKGRGSKDARSVGEFLASLKRKPDVFLVSPAERARRTAEIVAACISLSPRGIVCEKSLYEGSPDDILRLLVSLSDDIEAPLIVGHNPTLERIAVTLLVGVMEKGVESDTPTSPIRIPTAGLLCFEHDAPDWKSFGPGECVLQWMIYPKILK
jgi:phosphohistidine phosphatase